ncbi:uncharacterized protein LOC141616842 [Silene latifolia]|uniref:uncharacterized protein LOC141616842 n=1 Tax=Silene latifolia TaxID=37657 RepID=UPI003D7882F1
MASRMVEKKRGCGGRLRCKERHGDVDEGVREPPLPSPNNEEPPLSFSHNEEPYLSSLNIDQDSQDEKLDENIQDEELNENNQDEELDENNQEEYNLPNNPRKRVPILSYPVNERDDVRRRFIEKKPCRPRLSKNELPQTLIGKKKRRFNVLWYDLYDWLEYSVQNDAAICFYCYLFKDDTKCPGGDAFVKHGWNNWDKPLRLKKHVGSVGSAHNQAREKYTFFINKKTSIVQKIEKVSIQTKNLYKSRLLYSLQCLRYLLKQGLAFRGHKESENSSNRGNFLELLKWLAEKNETIAKVVLSKAPKNHKATSPKVQKDLIKCCSKETTKLIIEDLDNDLFAILADESSDVDDTTSLTLMKAIETLLGDHKLLMSNIRGQGYDGVSNMRGGINGLKNLVMRNSPSAYYVHCFAHQLQLTLVAVAKENCDCASFFQQLGFVLNVIGQSCKKLEMVRETQAKKVLEALGLNEIVSGIGLNQELGLSRLGDTRWGSHHKSIMNLIVMYSSMIDVLVKVGKDAKSNEDRAKAQSAVDHLESIEFIFMLHLMKVIFGYTNSLCEALQRKDQDIVNAMTLVDLTKKHLQDTRDHEWDNFLQSVSVFCAKLNIDVPSMSDSYVPRGRSRRFFYTKTNLQRFRIDMFLSVIDKQLLELNDRFDEVNTELLLCMACLSPVNSFASFDKKKLMRLTEFYPNEFCALDKDNLVFELDIYKSDMKQDLRFQQVKNLSELSMLLVETNKHVCYPLVYKLLKLVLILPVATISVERVFSSMTFVKNRLRNSMGNPLLNHCLVTYIEKDFFVQVSDDDVLKRFQNMKSRRMTSNI